MLFACMYYFKYLSIVNINLQRIKIIKSKEIKILRLPLLYVILKKLTTPLNLFIIFFTIIPIYYTISVLIFYGFQFNCGSLAPLINRYLFEAIIIFAGFMVGVFQVWDFLSHF